jgi:hypothetical protein
MNRRKSAYDVVPASLAAPEPFRVASGLPGAKFDDEESDKVALTNFKDGLWERLRDPKYCITFLSVALEDGGEEGFALAMQEVIRAWQREKATPIVKSSEERKAAIERIKELRKGNTLGGLSIKELRDEGRP